MSSGTSQQHAVADPLVLPTLPAGATAVMLSAPLGCNSSAAAPQQTVRENEHAARRGLLPPWPPSATSGPTVFRQQRDDAAAQHVEEEQLRGCQGAASAVASTLDATAIMPQPELPSSGSLVVEVQGDIAPQPPAQAASPRALTESDGGATPAQLDAWSVELMAHPTMGAFLEVCQADYVAAQPRLPAAQALLKLVHSASAQQVVEYFTLMQLELALFVLILIGIMVILTSSAGSYTLWIGIGLEAAGCLGLVLRGCRMIAVHFWHVA